MITTSLLRLAAAGLLLALSSVSLEAHGFKLLVFTKTAGFAHGSIPSGITAIILRCITPTRFGERLT
jgi:hypothetical protein